LSNNLPLFSIVMPTYNQVNYLSQSIESILKQDFTEWELIVIDNHSDDGTNELLKGIVDPRIRMVKIRNEGVIAKSRNMGIRNSTAPWIAFLDSDDFWETNKLSTIANIIQKYDPGLSYHGMRYVLNDVPGKRMKTRKLKRDAFIDLLINGNTIPNSSVVVKKGILYEVGLISESSDLIGAEDFNTWLKVTKAKIRIHYCNQTLGSYRLHENSFSSIAQKVLPLHATEEFTIDLSISLKVRMNCNNSYLLGRHSMIEEDYSQAVKYLWAAISGARFSLRLKAVLFLTTIPIRFIRLRMFRSN